MGTGRRPMVGKGLRVLKILNAAQASLNNEGRSIQLKASNLEFQTATVFPQENQTVNHFVPSNGCHR